MITLNNYEQYFLLYTDGELSEQEMDMVQEYASAHPQLLEELEMLLATKLNTEDNSITNFDFAGLYKSEEKEPVTMAVLIDLLHGEISDSSEIEAHINKSNALQEEWDLLKRTTLAKEPVIFAHKELLYRNETTVRPVYNMWRMVAAALFIGLMLLGGYKYFTQTESDSVEYVKTNDQIIDSAENQVPKQLPKKQTKNNLIATQQKVIVENNIASYDKNAAIEKINTTTNQTNKTSLQITTIKSAQDNFIVKSPSVNRTSDDIKKENSQKENNTIKNAVAVVETKKLNTNKGTNKVEIIDVDLSNVFAENAPKVTTVASFSEDESTILYMKTSKLKDSKVGLAFSKLKKIAKSKIGLGDDASISFHPIVINL